MELRTFITQAIIDIIGGVQDAQDQVEDGIVVPRDEQKLASQIIEFEVVVGSVESNGVEAKAGALIGVLGLGGSGKNSHDSTNHSTIKVKVPIKLPMTGEPKKRMSLDEMQRRLTGS